MAQAQVSRICKNCDSWLFAYRSAFEDFGTCDNPIVEGKVVLEKEYDGEIVIHTEATFGCIHFMPQHGNVITKLPNHDKSK